MAQKKKNASPLLKADAIAAMNEIRRVHLLNKKGIRNYKALGDAVGMRDIGIHLVRINPGDESTEYHTHYCDEEFVYILSGRGIGLVLSGGGARGFAHVGVIRALEEAGIPIDMIGGSSIGAVMGMVLALGAGAGAVTAAVRKAFLQHPMGNITGDYNFIPLVSLIKGARSRSAMMQAVRDATGTDVIDSEDCWITFFTVASNFSTGHEAVLLRGDLARNVSASYAIPGALPPIFIGGHMMYDGGTFNNFPVDVMAQLGAGRIIGVDLSIDREQRFDLDRVPGTLALLRDRLRPRAKRRYRLPSVPETLLRSSFITSIAKQKAMGTFTDLLFQPRVAEGRLLDWSRFDDVVAAGYSHAKDVLAGLTDEQRKMFR